MPNQKTSIKLIQLPDELIVKILQSFENQIDRRCLAQTCKRFYNLYKTRSNLNPFVLHVQGNTKNLFGGGLKILLNAKQGWDFDEVIMSKFDLISDLEVYLSKVDEIFGKPLEFYQASSYASRNVKALRLYECVVSPKVLVVLLKLMPNLNTVEIIRCCFSKKDNDIEENFKHPCENLIITDPLTTNDPRTVEAIMRMLPSAILKSYRCPVSKKRRLMRRANIRYKRLREYELGNVVNAEVPQTNPNHRLVSRLIVENVAPTNEVN